MFSTEEITRYSRHLLLPSFGIDGQEKLKNGRVLVVGAGGLGCPVLQYLTAAGVGHIGIVDNDLVALSNLQRQVLYTTHDIGSTKVEAAISRLSQQNPNIHFKGFPVRLTTDNALDILGNYDVIVDGTDNFATRYMVNDASVITGRPMVYGSVHRFEGQVAVFNFNENEGQRGPQYRHLFPDATSVDAIRNCSENGVLGILPGIIGMLQANEVIKIIADIGEVLSGKILTVNALNLSIECFLIDTPGSIGPEVPNTAETFKQYNYDLSCSNNTFQTIKNISFSAFKQLLSQGQFVQIIDVREHDELPRMAEWNAVQIPLGEIRERAIDISKEHQVVIFCQSGKRSQRAIKILQEEFQYNNLFNLEGGINSIFNTAVYG
ncbi:MAG: HesA/MoeB/ThiF family protein [Bacteroidia bacterium]|nr:HesA/MoeB/ThiF family protein [Bacteroidia bacterium]